MGIIELLLIAVSLSMDAFAVAVCKGLAMKKVSLKEPCIVGAWFGGFQALMPAIGFFLGAAFEKYITPIDHWVAFVLLGIIGAMDVEVDAVKALVTHKTVTRIAGADFVCGFIEGVTVCVCKCSPGKVNAAICTQAMIDNFGIE